MALIDIIILLTLFQLKHFLADYPLQNSQMVREKGEYGEKGGIYHSLIHSLLTFTVLGVFNYLVFPISYTLALAIAAIEFPIHYHIDWGKMQMSKRYTTKDKAFWNWMGFDQLLHQLTYVAFLWIVLK